MTSVADWALQIKYVSTYLLLYRVRKRKICTSLSVQEKKNPIGNIVLEETVIILRKHLTLNKNYITVVRLWACCVCCINGSSIVEW